MALLSIAVTVLPPLAGVASLAHTGPYGQAHPLAKPTHARADYLTGVLGKGIGRISGTVKEKGTPNAPVYRKVRLIRERDGLLIRELWSDPVTGAYSFDYIDELQTFTVLSYDHNGAFGAVVSSGLTLTNEGLELMP